MALPNSDQNRIRQLRRTDVEQTLAKLDRFIGDARWVPQTNRYASKTVEVIKSDLKQNAGQLRNPRHLSQYIAASCLLHCADGWSYLGRAIMALLRGDAHRVRHLAYYAELRAAMSVLASEGIGIFDRKHFVISAQLDTTKMATDLGTHRVVWECLSFWSGLPKSGDLFGSVISPHGQPLEEWLAPLGGINLLSPYAQKWFRQWGMDLKLPSDDRDARNQSSYRPDGLPFSWYVKADEALEITSEIWSLFGFSTNRVFTKLDDHLLRIALEQVFKGREGIEASMNHAKYAIFVKDVIRGQALEEKIAEHWQTFLLRRTSPNDPRVIELSTISPTDPDLGHVAVIARAALLLRVAAGSSAQLLLASGYTTDKLRFWWSGLGASRGLWEQEIDDDAIVDSWDDISLLLNDVESFQDSTAPNELTFHRIGNELPHVITGFGGCERFAVWSILS